MEFLDTTIKGTPIVDKKVVLTTDIHAKVAGTNNQHLIPKSCYPKIQTKNMPIRVAGRVRSNCSDKGLNAINYKERLIKYKPYLMNSGHDKKEINKTFCKR